MTSIGFTGTRKGMALAQWAKVDELLHEMFDVEEYEHEHEWHVGDCIGADNQAHNCVLKLREIGFAIRTFGHVPNHDQYRTHRLYDVELKPRPYLARNREIVNASDLMIAAPFEYFEEMRGSGTWATIRYTQRRRKTLIIVWPNGSGVTERRR